MRPLVLLLLALGLAACAPAYSSRDGARLRWLYGMGYYDTPDAHEKVKASADLGLTKYDLMLLTEDRLRARVAYPREPASDLYRVAWFALRPCTLLEIDLAPAIAHDAQFCPDGRWYVSSARLDVVNYPYRDRASRNETRAYYGSNQD